MYDLLIKNARIADGSGRPLLRGDIAVKDGRFCRVAPEIGETAAEIMEAGGLIAAPGFIDCHSHDDRAMLLGLEMSIEDNCLSGVAVHESSIAARDWFENSINGKEESE